jgi:GTPase involved in cell partitioning and DNA repair
MKHTKEQTEKHAKIQIECQETFEQIQQIQEILKWTNSNFYEKTHIALLEEYDDFASDENEQLKKFKDKTKKMFSRKSWAKSKATNATLQSLKEILNAIYQCDDYRYSEINGSLISLESRKRHKKTASNLNKWIKTEDNEK